MINHIPTRLLKMINHIFTRLLKRFFHVHEWTNWSAICETEVGRKQQWRICVHCHKVTYHNLSYDGCKNLPRIHKVIKEVYEKHPQIKLTNLLKDNSGIGDYND